MRVELWVGVTQSGLMQMNLGLVRAYSVPIKDRKASELVTWHVKALQRALDLIWNNIEWGYRFPELGRKVGSWS